MDKIIEISENLYKIVTKTKKQIIYPEDKNYKDLFSIFNWILNEYKLYIFIYPVYNMNNELFYQYELVDLTNQQFPISYKEFNIKEYIDILYFSINETLKYILDNYD